MAYENPTTYTEADPNSKITLTSTRCTWADLAENDVAYVLDDKGAAHFNDNFEHLNTIYRDSDSDAGGQVYCWGLSNATDTLWNIYDNNGDCLQLRLDNGTMYLLEIYGGAADYDGDSFSNDTPYYPKIKYDKAVGTYGTLYCYLYDDSGRTNLVFTLSITLHKAISFKNVYFLSNFDPSASVSYGYVENLDLQEGGAPTVKPAWYYQRNKMRRAC